MKDLAQSVIHKGRVKRTVSAFASTLGAPALGRADEGGADKARDKTNGARHGKSRKHPHHAHHSHHSHNKHKAHQHAAGEKTMLRSE